MPTLRRSSDDEPGLRRRKRGPRFAYFDPAGRQVRDPAEIARIDALAIPPAWRRVWICASANGHLQATGFDAAGRKQYRYHDAWRARREREKYERILRFAEQLPRIRRMTRRHVGRAQPDRARALATVVQLLDQTSLRIGHEEYARRNGSYGLATLRSRHVRVEGDVVVMQFTGKAGVRQRAVVEDGPIARAIAAMDELNGRDAFKYVDDDGRVVDVTAGEVNAYIKELAGDEFSAKDFRTWTATVAAAVAVDELEPVTSDAAGKRAVAAVTRTVADLLGNTPAVCRSSYIDPRVFDQYLDGCTLSTLRGTLTDVSIRGLSVHELLVLSLLRRGLERRAARTRPPRNAKAAA